jgi:hypothetical protein
MTLDTCTAALPFVCFSAGVGLLSGPFLCGGVCATLELEAGELQGLRGREHGQPGAHCRCHIGLRCCKGSAVLGPLRGEGPAFAKGDAWFISELVESVTGASYGRRCFADVTKLRV